MAFAKLFTGLLAVEDVKCPGQPAFAHRYETENGEKGNARKRKTQGEQTGSYKKKKCSQARTTRTRDATLDDSKATHYPVHDPDRERAGVGVIRGHIRKNMGCKGQNYKTKNSRKVNKSQEHTKKTEWKNNPHQQKAGGRPAYRGARPPSGDFEVKRTRFMTQEFKDQNALLVDGRILCRHFLWGRCIKGDDCQLEHMKGFNDLIKEACKFYIQGLCTKGESCPYMHKSFPCKFFHRKGKCFQGADCRFSHEPLNDVTKRLLEEQALKWDSDLSELAKKAEQESQGQPEHTDGSKTTEADRTPDILLQPLLPNFYKSADTNAEEEALLRQTGELAANMEQAVPPRSPPPANLDPKEPVCYSVEAILGPQLSKPFPSFFTTPRSQDSAPLSSSSSADQVPYSVDAVLKSCKSVQNPTYGHTPAPPTAPTATSSPKTDFEEIPPRSSLTHNEKVNMRDKANRSQERKMVKSPSLASGDHMKQRENMPESLTPAKTVAREVKVELLQPPVALAEKSSKSKGDMKGGTHLPMDVKSSGNCKSEGILPLRPFKYKGLYSGPPSPTSTSRRPALIKPHLSVLTLDSKASFKPFCASAGFTRFKGRAAVPAGPIACSTESSDSAERPSDIHLRSKKTQVQHGSTETTAEGSEEMAHGALAVGCKTTLKSLFTRPATDTLRPAGDSADSRSNRPETAAEPDKASARSFLSLFVAPLCDAALPDSRTSSASQRSTHSVDNTSPVSGQGASEMPLPRQVRADVRETFSPNPKAGRDDSSAERANQPAKQQVKPARTLASTSPSETPAHQQLPHTSPLNERAAETPTSSVLKTLFLRLSPYRQDAEASEKKDGSSAGCVFVKQRRESKRKGRRKKKPQTQDSHKQSSVETVARSAEPQASPQTPPQTPQTPQTSPGATAGSTLGSPGPTEARVRNSGTHNLPLESEAPPSQPKHTSEEGTRVDGSVATPLKDLFKTLDLTVFHSGH